MVEKKLIVCKEFDGFSINVYYNESTREIFLERSDVDKFNPVVEICFFHGNGTDYSDHWAGMRTHEMDSTGSKWMKG